MALLQTWKVCYTCSALQWHAVSIHPSAVLSQWCLVRYYQARFSVVFMALKIGMISSPQNLETCSHNVHVALYTSTWFFDIGAFLESCLHGNRCFSQVRNWFSWSWSVVYVAHQHRLFGPMSYVCHSLVLSSHADSMCAAWGKSSACKLCRFTAYYLTIVMSNLLYSLECNKL